MQRRIRYPLLIIIPLSLLIGITWGLKIQRDREAEARGHGEPKAEIRILAFKGLLTAELLNRFERETSIRARVTEVGTPEELWDKMGNVTTGESPAEPPYDVVSVFSFQVPLAMQMARLQPMDIRLIPNLKNAAPDFRDLPGDRSFQGVVPTLWGVTGIFYDSKKFSAPPRSWGDVAAEVSKKAGSKLQLKVLWPSSTTEFARIAKVPSDVKDLKRYLQPWLSLVTVAPDALTIAPTLSASFAVAAAPSAAAKNAGAFAAALVSHGEVAFPPLAGLSDWRFTIPDDGAALWTLGFAVHHDTKLVGEAHAFLDYVLEREAALELARAFRQASTNRLLESSDIDQRLKPSYLRQVPLTKLTLVKEFSRSREIRELIPLAR